tara:strand:+ start:166 stop:468 length:303 start_codon:yes stop_codon:yes gene_type:complete
MKINSLIYLILLFLLTYGCQTVKQKSDEIVKKENEKFGKYLGEQSIKLKMDIGDPTEDFVNEIGNEILVYKTKKYGVPCERKFEVNASGMIIGFSTSGCI